MAQSPLEKLLNLNPDTISKAVAAHDEVMSLLEFRGALELIKCLDKEDGGAAINSLVRRYSDKMEELYSRIPTLSKTEHIMCILTILAAMNFIVQNLTSPKFESIPEKYKSNILILLGALVTTARQ